MCVSIHVYPCLCVCLSMSMCMRHMDSLTSSVVEVRVDDIQEVVLCLCEEGVSSKLPEQRSTLDLQTMSGVGPSFGVRFGFLTECGFVTECGFF